MFGLIKVRNATIMFIESVYERGALSHKGNDVNTVNTRIDRITAGELVLVDWT